MPKALRFLGWPVLVGVLLALLIIQHNPELVGLPRQEVHVEQAPLLSRLQEGPVSYANAVSRAAPAVANLYTTKMVSKPSHPLFDDPMFRRFFGDNLPQQKRMESSLGSAVIMSAEGYLLTNNHLTAGADQIIVALRDGRETIAQLVGSDPETDLAVLKIDLKNLPAMTLGRSDGIRTGDVCLAIGNPFGVGQTVTMGIISATGRNQLGLNTYEDFIQTDAAINPGIGVEVKALTPELAESLGLGETAGIVVAGVYRDGPAARGGLLPGDVILTIDKQEASDGRRSMNQVARTRPGQKISIVVLRNGQKVNLTAEVGLRPPPAPAPQQKQDGGE
ncbi:PDZ domain-containing protein [Pseudomonas aeruginosa]|nr:PDZ domain-containing protein [Pseudomonas aeruginosa]